MRESTRKAMKRNTRRNDSDESASNDARGPRCSQCTEAGLDCMCMQHNFKFRMYTGPKIQHVKNENRAAAWVEWLTLSLIAIYGDKRWNSPFGIKHTSLTCNVPGADALSTRDIVANGLSPRDRLYQCLQDIAKTKPNFETSVLDCQVTADGQRREATSWVLTRQTGMFSASADLGQEVLIKYCWREVDGVWKCIGFAGIKGPGAWVSPEFVPMDTSRFLDADTNGTLLQKNEYNFNTGADAIMSASDTTRAKNNLRWHRLVRKGDQDNPEATLDSLGTFNMLMSEQRRRTKSSSANKYLFSKISVGWMSALSHYPHADENVDIDFPIIP